MNDILVAGRDLSQIQFIRRILIRRGICDFNDIVLLCNGLQTREALIANSYKLVILNEDLDGMKGLDCIQFLKLQHVEHRILLVVHNPIIEITREAFLLGVRGIYEVPILIDGFTAMIHNLLVSKRIDSGADIYDLYTKYRFYDPLV